MKQTRGLTLWLTGLSGSGKSTIANSLRDFLVKNCDESLKIEILDGDEVRENLCADLSFSKEDRITNVNRIAFLAGKLSKHGVLVIVPVIAPYKEAREKARSLSENFAEVYIKADIETVTERDVKGLYKKAIAGEIENFTGISDPYETPENPDLVLDTQNENIEESKEKLINYLIENEYISQT